MKSFVLLVILIISMVSSLRLRKRNLDDENEPLICFDSQDECDERKESYIDALAEAKILGITGKCIPDNGNPVQYCLYSVPVYKLR